MHRRRAVGAAVVTLLLSSVSLTAASAASTQPVLLTSIASIAEGTEPIDDQETAVKIDESDTEWVNEFNTLATELEEGFPDDFAASEIAPDHASGWIGFRAGVPEAAAEAAEGITGVEWREGLGYSAKAVTETITEILQITTDQIGPGASVVVYQEGNARHLVVQVGPATDEDAGVFAPTELHSIKDAVSRLGAELKFSTAVGIFSSPVTEPQAFDGGRVVAGVCTGSFPIKRNGGPELGILTAGHCPGTGSYSGVSAAFYPVYPFSLSTTNAIPGGDFRWNHSKTMLTGRTYLANAGTRTFASSALASVGSPICKYGMTSGYGCSTVAYTNLSNSAWISEGNAYYTVGPLRGVEGYITQGGDSGGPWFYGNTAYGIHHGVPGGHSAWSNVTYALSKLGVSLWTG